MIKSAVARFVATGMLWTLHTLSSARMSGSCGCALRGSTKKNTASTSRIAARAAIWVSPPSGPERSSSTESPIFRSSRRAVCRVAVREKPASVSRLKVAHATRSTFLLSCAISASRLGGSATFPGPAQSRNSDIAILLVREMGSGTSHSGEYGGLSLQHHDDTMKNLRVACSARELGDRQRDVHGRSAPGLALDAELAAVREHEVLHDGEPEAGPAELA